METLRIAATFIASAKGVREVVGRRLALYPQTEMNDGEWAAWWADYVEALADVPLAALEAGMSAWVRSPDSRFMPKPGELRQLAMTTPNTAQMNYLQERARIENARWAAYHAEQARLAPPPDPAGLQAADPVDIQKMLADLKRDIPLRRMPNVPPAVQAKVDETGVSPELRERVRGAKE